MAGVRAPTTTLLVAAGFHLYAVFLSFAVATSVPARPQPQGGGGGVTRGRVAQPQPLPIPPPHPAPAIAASVYLSALLPAISLLAYVVLYLDAAGYLGWWGVDVNAFRVFGWVRAIDYALTGPVSILLLHTLRGPSRRAAAATASALVVLPSSPASRSRALGAALALLLSIASGYGALVATAPVAALTLLVFTLMCVWVVLMYMLEGAARATRDYPSYPTSTTTHTPTHTLRTRSNASRLAGFLSIYLSLLVMGYATVFVVHRAVGWPVAAEEAKEAAALTGLDVLSKSAVAILCAGASVASNGKGPWFAWPAAMLAWGCTGIKGPGESLSDPTAPAPSIAALTAVVVGPQPPQPQPQPPPPPPRPSAAAAAEKRGREVIRESDATSAGASSASVTPRGGGETLGDEAELKTALAADVGAPPPLSIPEEEARSPGPRPNLEVALGTVAGLVAAAAVSARESSPGAGPSRPRPAPASLSPSTVAAARRSPSTPSRLSSSSLRTLSKRSISRSRFLDAATSPSLPTGAGDSGLPPSRGRERGRVGDVIYRDPGADHLLDGGPRSAFPSSSPSRTSPRAGPPGGATVSFPPLALTTSPLPLPPGVDLLRAIEAARAGSSPSLSGRGGGVGSGGGQIDTRGLALMLGTLVLQMAAEGGVADDADSEAEAEEEAATARSPPLEAVDRPALVPASSPRASAAAPAAPVPAPLPDPPTLLPVLASPRTVTDRLHAVSTSATNAKRWSAAAAATAAAGRPGGAGPRASGAAAAALRAASQRQRAAARAASAAAAHRSVFPPEPTGDAANGWSGGAGEGEGGEMEAGGGGEEEEEEGYPGDESLALPLTESAPVRLVFAGASAAASVPAAGASARRSAGSSARDWTIREEEDMDDGEESGSVRRVATTRPRLSGAPPPVPAVTAALSPSAALRSPVAARRVVTVSSAPVASRAAGRGGAPVNAAAAPAPPPPAAAGATRAGRVRVLGGV
jgi:hypothetical protein